MEIDIKAVLDILKSGVIDLANKSYKTHVKEAVSDGHTAINDLKEKIESWTIWLAAGGIDREEFESLVLGEKDLLKIKALTQAGYALIRIDQFKRDIFDLIINTITSAVLP
jgi:hypothetical protein